MRSLLAPGFALLLGCTGGGTGKPDSDVGDTADSTDSDAADTDTSTTELAAEGDAKLVGETAGASWEMAATIGGDLDGDGKDDLVVGCSSVGEYSDREGRTYVFTNRIPSGVSSLAGADATFRIADETSVGRSPAIVGDVNLDGIDDLLVGDVGYYADDGGRPGRAILLYGPIVGALDEDDIDASLIGEWGDYTGYPDTATGALISAAGDVDGDGGADILIGAPYVVGDHPVAYLVTGPQSGEVMLADDATMRLYDAGYRARGAGDTNGDGFDDIVVAIEQADQTVILFEGPVSGDLTAADADVTIGGDGVDYHGRETTGVGDVDGDGYDDLLLDAGLGPEEIEDGGAVTLLSGPFADGASVLDPTALLYGPDDDTDAGSAIDGAGDVNGDGLADLLIGCQSDHVDAPGGAYVVLGPVSGTNPLDAVGHHIIGDSAGDRAGAPVAGGGDLDGDGLDDVIIGEPYDDDAAEDAGAIWVVYATTILGM